MAAEGTWIVSTGGSKLKKRGKLIYAMKVADKLPISHLIRLPEHAHRRKAFGYRRGCNEEEARHGKWMLAATEFYYFGEGAIKIPSYLNPPHAPQAGKGGPESLEKRGPGYKSKFSASFVQKFETWIRRHKPGRHNLPHHLDPGTRMFLEGAEL